MSRAVPALSPLPRARRVRLRCILAAMLATAALLALSLLSMQVAAERARVATLDRQVDAAQRRYAALATEFDIRSRPGLLTAWGDAGLALAPPHVRQYLDGLGALQALARPVPDPREIASR